MMNRFTKTAAMTLALIGLLWIAPAAAQESADLSAEQILKKTLDTYDGVKSHKYTWYAEGMDTFTKDRQKEMTGNYDSFAKKVKVKHEVEEDAKLTRGKYEIEHMKPYLQQMVVVRSDFTPSIVWGTLITYRSDKYQDVWWAKPKISPVAIKRSVEKDDAGGALTSNWTVALTYMQFYAANADLSRQPDAEFDGKTCYVIRYTFDWEKRPAWTSIKLPFDKYGVTDPVRKIIESDMKNIEKQKFSHIDYYIDKETFWLRKIEEYVEGNFHWRNMFRDIEVNTLTEKDF